MVQDVTFSGGDIAALSEAASLHALTASTLVHCIYNFTVPSGLKRAAICCRTGVSVKLSPAATPINNEAQGPAPSFLSFER